MDQIVRWPAESADTQSHVNVQTACPCYNILNYAEFYASKINTHAQSYTLSSRNERMKLV